MAILRNISPSTFDDATLMASYRETGDLEVLAALYGRYLDLCYAVALKYLKDADAAKDAVMEVFEEMIDKLRKHEVASFRSWLYTVVKNHCLMKLRAASKNKKVTLHDDFVQFIDESHQEDARKKEWQLQEMSKCIDKLGSDQKISVELFYLQGKCYKEIADITGLEWNKVRSLIQNGRRNIKICMEKSTLSASSK